MKFTDSSNSQTVFNNSFFQIDSIQWKKPKFRILPIILTQQLNTHHPFGWNDGVMIQSKGYQSFFRPGVNLRYGFFEIQASPEFLYVQNSSYPTNFQYGNNFSSSISSLSLGQSFFKIHLGSITLGVSNENLWWGPGINSSLLMSNNAPGFLHAHLSTNKPINTPIGNFEFNFIGARLTSKSNLGYEINHLQTRNINDDWRYLNSYVISWQPRWTRGLFLGMTRSLQQYGNKAFTLSSGFINKYMPVLGLPIEKKYNLGDDTLTRDQLASFFIRWVFPKSKIEFYVEYGKNDYGLNFRDYLLAPSHSSAYLLGFRKLFKRNTKNYIILETEITQMSQTPDYLVRTAGNWYEHSRVFQGYTNNNQILGSGAGLGSDIQTISAIWVNGNNRNSFQLQRIERDPIDKLNKWTDLSIGWMPQWKYKNMLLGAKVQLIRSQNYSWEKGKNPFNLHSRLMVQYNFK